MKVFNKLVFICNVCCLAFPFLRFIETGTKAAGNKDALIEVPAVTGILLVLGIGAVFINFIFVLVFLIRYFKYGKNIDPRWITYFNLVMFPLQIWYFELYKL